LQALRAQGAMEVEFTGGEPTIRNDLAELAGYARQLGFVNISVITNGLRLASARYLDSLVQAGVNDFLFSVHGHTAELHDEHTATPGSFARVTAAMRNARAAGKRCRATTTVTNKNFAHLEAIVGLLIDHEVDCIHLAVFSPVAQATNTDNGMAVRYTDAAHSIKCAIDKHRDRMPLLSVKYIPFCFMRGYEQYVMNLYQQSFDPDDWNYYYSNKIRRTGTKFQRFAFDCLVSAGALLAKRHSFSRQHGWLGFKVLGLTRIVELLRKVRTDACRRCRYDIVCDHVWKGYVERFGDSEIAPVVGPKVTDPAWCYDLARSREPGARLVARSVQCQRR
jgi:MoaA/NifB/PqqE/SkfB family radical SAM enzyme